MKGYLRLGIAIITMWHGTAMAIWVQGEASLNFTGADLDSVRPTVIKNAIADASYKSGSVIAAEDVLIDGLILSSKAELRTAGRIQRVEIISESVQDNVLSVVVNVNLTPLFDCEPNRFQKRLLVTHFALLDSRQAATGGIYNIGKHITQRFAQQLKNTADTPNVMQISQAMTSADMWSAEALSGVELQQKSTYLRDTYGQQFALFGYIKDVSLFEQIAQSESFFDSDEVAVRRNFTLQVFVLDTFRQRIIYNDSYHSEADWEFENSYQVDTNNSLFWRSEYGRMVLNTVNAAVTDISAAITCEPTFARVVNTSNQQLIVDLGIAQGIREGDSFQLYKQQSLPVLLSPTKSVMLPVENGQFAITHLGDEVSVLKVEGAESAVHLYDIVSPVQKKDAN